MVNFDGHSFGNESAFRVGREAIPFVKDLHNPVLGPLNFQGDLANRHGGWLVANFRAPLRARGKLALAGTGGDAVVAGGLQENRESEKNNQKPTEISCHLLRISLISNYSLGGE